MSPSTQTTNEAALLTTDPAGLDAQSEDGNWTWTLGASKYTISTGDLSDLVDYWRAEHQGESLLAAIEGFTASQRQQEIETYDLLEVLEGTAVQDEFRIGDSRQNLYGIPVNQGAEGSIVVIKDFNPFLDTVELYLRRLRLGSDPYRKILRGSGWFCRPSAGHDWGAMNGLPSASSASRSSTAMAAKSFTATCCRNTGRTTTPGLSGPGLRAWCCASIRSLMVCVPETLIFFDGIDQDLLHFQTSFNEGHLRFASADDDARRQLRFIVSNNGTDRDTIWMKRMLIAFRSVARCWVTGSMTPSPACRNSSES